MENKKYFVEGMHCSSCEIYIENKLKKIEGISNIKSNSKTQVLHFDVKKNLPVEDILTDVNKEIKKDGYKISNTFVKKETNWSNIPLAITIAVIIILLFEGIQRIGVGSSLYQTELTLPIVFLLGIVASISSCMAVVGSLILSISSTITKKGKSFNILSSFHISRLISFFILGGVLGSLGSLITINRTVEISMAVFLFFIMVILAINLLDISPIFKKLQPTLPKSVFGNMSSKIKMNSLFAPIILGFVTFFLPCGFTQSMQINAIMSGSFIQGSLTMFIFALGTLPALILISIGSKKFGEGSNSDLFFKISGFLVLFFAIYNLLGTLVSNGVVPPIF